MISPSIETCSIYFFCFISDSEEKWCPCLLFLLPLSLILFQVFLWLSFLIFSDFGSRSLEWCHNKVILVVLCSFVSKNKQKIPPYKTSFLSQSVSPLNKGNIELPLVSFRWAITSSVISAASPFQYMPLSILGIFKWTTVYLWCPFLLSAKILVLSASVSDVFCCFQMLLLLHSSTAV